MTVIEMSTLSTIMESTEDYMKTEREEWVFVDIQGYKVNKNRFMCKEFCLIDGDEMFHQIVKSWFPFNKLLYHYKRQIDWLTNFYHGLKYDSDGMHIDELTRLVYPKLADKIIIVKGFEKIKWLKYIFRKHGDIVCRNIEDLDFDMSEQSCYQRCDQHDAWYGWREYRCAKSNALTLRDISVKNAPIRFF